MKDSRLALSFGGRLFDAILLRHQIDAQGHHSGVAVVAALAGKGPVDIEFNALLVAP